MDIHGYNSILESAYQVMIDSLLRDKSNNSACIDSERIISIDYNNNKYVFQFYFKNGIRYTHIDSHKITIHSKEYEIENSFMTDRSSFYLYLFVSSVQNEEIYGFIHGHLLTVYYANIENIIYDYAYHMDNYGKSQMLSVDSLTIYPDWFPYGMNLKRKRS